MPTLAMSTYSFGPDATAKDGIDFAVKNGFHGLELGSYTLWPRVMDSADRRYLRAQADLNDVDLSIHFIHRGVAPASHDLDRRDKHLQELRETVALMSEIGARVVVVHPGPIHRAGTEPVHASETIREEARENLKEFLESIAPVAQEAGVLVCVENLHHAPGQVIQSYDELTDLVSAVGSPSVQITLDVGHADLNDGITSAFEKFAPFLRHVHLHDCDGERDHLEIGLGVLNFLDWEDTIRAFPHALVLETRNDEDPPGGVLRSRDRIMSLFGEGVR